MHETAPVGHVVLPAVVALAVKVEAVHDPQVEDQLVQRHLQLLLVLGGVQGPQQGLHLDQQGVLGGSGGLLGFRGRFLFLLKLFNISNRIFY